MHFLNSSGASEQVTGQAARAAVAVAGAAVTGAGVAGRAGVSAGGPPRWLTWGRGLLRAPPPATAIVA